MYEEEAELATGLRSYIYFQEILNYKVLFSSHINYFPTNFYLLRIS